MEENKNLNGTSCIFCKIAGGKILHDKIFENDNVVVFLDNSPVNEGHSLVIPKGHFENIFEVPDEILCEMIKVSKKLSLVIKNSVQADGINIHMNNGKDAGQAIEHAHIHIIPRFKGDGFNYWQGRKIFSPEEKQNTAKKIISSL